MLGRFRCVQNFLWILHMEYLNPIANPTYHTMTELYLRPACSGPVWCLWFGILKWHVCLVITHSKSMDQPGKVANPARGQLSRENECFPVSVCAWEFGLARRVRPSRPASASSFSTLRLGLVLTHEIPPKFRGGVHLFILNAIRHRASPEIIGSRNCVPMAFTVESPPAQGQ